MALLPTNLNSRSTVGRENRFWLSNLLLGSLCLILTYVFLTLTSTINNFTFCLWGGFFIILSENCWLVYQDLRIFRSNVILNNGKNKKIQGKIVLEVFIAVCSGVFVFYLMLIFFGASILEDSIETLLLSCILSCLTFLPYSLVFGLNVQSIIQSIESKKNNKEIESFLLNLSKYTVVGSWLGSFVIPLDWDRPWQTWPMPCILGIATALAYKHLVAFVFSLNNVMQRKKSK